MQGEVTVPKLAFSTLGFQSTFEQRHSRPELKGGARPKKDRYQVEITLAAEKVHVGPMKGSIFIDTNDVEFPRVIVPVSGQIVER